MSRLAGLRRASAESWAAMRSVFANPALRRLQVASGASVFGQWFYSIALAVFAYQADGATGVALVALVRFGLGGLAAPLLAVLGDRLPRRSVMVASDLVRATAIAVAAAAVAADAPALVVYAMAVVVTVASSAFYPAEAALIPDLARAPEEVTAANVVNGTLANIGGLAGPALGGLLYAATGAEVVFLVTAVTFAVSASFLVRLPPGERPAPDPDGPPQDGVVRTAIAGFGAVRGDRDLRTVIGLYTASAATWGVLSVVIVVIALEDLGLGEEGTGYLMGALSVGGLVGGAGAAVLAGSGRLGRTLGVGSLVWGLPLVALAALVEPWMALACLIAVGVGETLIEVSTMTLLQRLAREDQRARVFGVLESLTVGAIALGGALAAPALALMGPRGTLVAVGLTLPALAVLLMGRLGAIDRDTVPPAAEVALLRGVPMFAPLPPPVIEGLAVHLGTRRVAAGEAVVTEGEPGDLFYVAAEGAFRVEQGGVTLRDLGAGDFFGEIALLREIPRTATVTATADGVLRTLDRERFVAAVTGHAPSAEAAEAVVESRLGFRVA